MIFCWILFSLENPILKQKHGGLYRKLTLFEPEGSINVLETQIE